MYGWLYFSDFGTNKLEAKTKTDSKVEFTSKLDHNHDTGKVAGSLETKYKWKDYGKFTFKSPLNPWTLIYWPKQNIFTDLT